MKRGRELLELPLRPRIGQRRLAQLYAPGSQQLAPLLRDAALQLVALRGFVDQLFLEPLQRVRVGLDADLDRAGRLVGVDVVKR